MIKYRMDVLSTDLSDAPKMDSVSLNKKNVVTWRNWIAKISSNVLMVHVDRFKRIVRMAKAVLMKPLSSAEMANV